MKNRTFRKFCALLLASLTVFTVSCGIPLPGSEGSSEKGDDARESVAEGKSFAEAHDAFQTTLVREETDDSAIPEPPEGVLIWWSILPKWGTWQHMYPVIRETDRSIR